MAKAKRALAARAGGAAAKAQPAVEPISVKPAVNPTTGFLTVNVFDGTRQLLPRDAQILLTVRDGAQNQLFRDFIDGPTAKLELPFHNNFADNYAIIAFADGYEQAGFQPIAIGPNVPAQLDLMLLPKDADFHFAKATWNDVLAKKPLLAQIFSASVTGAAGDAYGDLMEDHPDRLACLLNITTAMQQISLPVDTPWTTLRSSTWMRWRRIAYLATRAPLWSIRCGWPRNRDCLRSSLRPTSLYTAMPPAASNRNSSAKRTCN